MCFSQEPRQLQVLGSNSCNVFSELIPRIRRSFRFGEKHASGQDDKGVGLTGCGAYVDRIEPGSNRAANVISAWRRGAERSKWQSFSRRPFSTPKHCHVVAKHRCFSGMEPRHLPVLRSILTKLFSKHLPITVRPLGCARGDRVTWGNGAAHKPRVLNQSLSCAAGVINTGGVGQDDVNSSFTRRPPNHPITQ